MSDTAPAAGESALHDRLLRVAQQRFQKFGYRRTGIAEIARDAGVAAGTVYRYFKDKEDLFRAVVEREHGAWIAVARRILAEPGTAGERLSKLAQGSVTFHREHIMGSVLASDTEMIHPPLVQELQQKLVQGCTEPMAEVIRDGIARGEFRDLDPERTARVLFLCGQALFRDARDDFPELMLIMGELARGGLQNPKLPASRKS